jgi:DNA-binding phage protein
MADRTSKPEDIAATLSQALARGDPASFTATLMEIIKERGMTSGQRNGRQPAR